MIKIHRSRPFADVGWERVRLSWAQHQLLVILGMMDNKVVPTDLLMETALGIRSQAVLWQKIHRLRNKIGVDRIQHRRGFGYMLVGDVKFFE